MPQPLDIHNLFKHTANQEDGEQIDKLMQTPHFKVERIISQGHTTPEGQWYDQSTNEYVLLLQGSATLVIENEPPLHLNAGDYLIIPAHTKHRVTHTQNQPATIWLCIHY